MVCRTCASSNAAGGFAVVQALIVAAIVVAVVVTAVPVYAARAKTAVLEENARTLENEIKAYLALGLDTTWVPDGETTDERAASRVITQALRASACGASAFYINPFSGSRNVVCHTERPTPTEGPPVAVWITDDRSYSYSAFSASPATRSLLAGTLIIVFIVNGGQTNAIEIYYVDDAGERSQTATTLAL